MEAASLRSSSTSSLHTEEKDLQEEQRFWLRLFGSRSTSGAGFGSDLCRKWVPVWRVEESSLSQQARVRQSWPRPRPSRPPWETSWSQRV